MKNDPSNRQTNKSIVNLYCIFHIMITLRPVKEQRVCMPTLISENDSSNSSSACCDSWGCDSWCR